MEKCGLERRSVNNIEINPEMCKNLETAVPKILDWISTSPIRAEGTILKILGFGKGFVPLYLQTVRWGIVIEVSGIRNPGNDAFRRDCIINALFCDLHTELVENFTGLGQQDIAASAIHTPERNLRLQSPSRRPLDPPCFTPRLHHSSRR